MVVPASSDFLARPSEEEARAALIASQETFCHRCKVEYGQYGCEHAPARTASPQVAAAARLADIRRRWEPRWSNRWCPNDVSAGMAARAAVRDIRDLFAEIDRRQGKREWERVFNEEIRHEVDCTWRGDGSEDDECLCYVTRLHDAIREAVGDA